MSDSDDRDHSRGGEAVSISVVFTSLALVTVALRFYTRACIVRNVGLEDHFIAGAFAFSVALTALICYEVANGQGRHFDTLTAHEYLIILRAMWASVPIYQVSLTLTKVSILLQYLRVFVSTKMRRTILGMLGVVVVYGAWSVLSTLFMCAPVSFFWNKNQKGHCLNQAAVWFTNAALNILTDFAVFLLPMPCLKELHLPRRQKYGLMAVFALGGFVCLTSILRLRALYEISISKDVTYDNGPAAYWSSIESNVGIICSTIPTLKAMVSRFFPRMLSTSSGNRSRARTGTALSGFASGQGRASGDFLRLNGANIEMTSGKAEGLQDVENGEIRVVTVVEQRKEEATDTAVETASNSSGSQRDLVLKGKYLAN